MGSDSYESEALPHDASCALAYFVATDAFTRWGSGLVDELPDFALRAAGGPTASNDPVPHELREFVSGLVKAWTETQDGPPDQ